MNGKYYKEVWLMKLENGNLILKRPYKEVYKCDNSIVKYLRPSIRSQQSLMRL